MHRIKGGTKLILKDADLLLLWGQRVLFYFCLHSTCSFLYKKTETFGMATASHFLIVEWTPGSHAKTELY